MNCDDFQRRLDSLLDERQDVADDTLLRQHCEQCNECASRLMIWSHIESYEPPPRRGDTAAWNAVIAMAAAILVCVTVTWRPDNNVMPQPAIVAATPESDTWEVDDWGSVEFWSVVQRQDWMDQTMPAVDSMARGVAPIGRSVQQAAAILMNQIEPSGSNPVLVEPVAPGERTTEVVVAATGVLA
ncbi:MAG: hypothetical protein AAFX06_05820 [Planctomycetota bacterium]